MNAFFWIHLEITEFVLNVSCTIYACLRYTSVLPVERFNGGSGGSSLVPRLTYVSDFYITMAQISMHNKISIRLYPCVVLYEVRDQVCSHFSSDCGGLSRPVALVYSTLIGPSAYHSHCSKP